MQHRYPCGSLSRRQSLTTSAATVPLISALPALAAAADPQALGKVTHQGGADQPQGKLGAPGLYPGQVVEVKNPAMIHNGKRNTAAIKATMDRGIKELTGATDAVEGWKH